MEILTIVIGGLGFIAAAIGVLVSAKVSSDARNLQVILELSADYRKRWQEDWLHAVKMMEEHKSAHPSSGKLESTEPAMRSMLNWIDWYGNILESGLFRRSDVFNKAVGPSMLRGIEAGRSIVKRDNQIHGSSYWLGLQVVEKLLENEKRRWK